LWYAMRLFEFPVGVFVTALSTAALPSLAAQAQQGELIPLCASLGFALRLVNFVALPASVGLFLLAEPLSSVLFFHGAFGAGDVQKTAAALQGYAVGLWAIAATRLLSACLYALQDTRTPVIGSAIAFVVKVAFSVMLMGEVVLTAGAHSAARFVAWLTAACTVVRWGVTGLAVAASLSAFVNLLVQASVVIRRCGGFPWAAWRSSLMWSLAGCSVMAILLRWVAAQIAWVDAGTPFVERCIVLTAAILLGGVSYLVVAWQGGSNEFRALAGTLPQCALRFLPQFLQPRA
jgi:putative peptidoglycan lipid II flippase